VDDQARLVGCPEGLHKMIDQLNKSSTECDTKINIKNTYINNSIFSFYLLIQKLKYDIIIKQHNANCRGTTEEPKGTNVPLI